MGNLPAIVTCLCRRFRLPVPAEPVVLGVLLQHRRLAVSHGVPAGLLQVTVHPVVVPGVQPGVDAGHDAAGEEATQPVVDQLRDPFPLRLCLGLPGVQSQGNQLLHALLDLVVIAAGSGQGRVGDPVCHGGAELLGCLDAALHEEILDKSPGDVLIYQLVQGNVLKGRFGNARRRGVKHGLFPAHAPVLDAVGVVAGRCAGAHQGGAQQLHHRRRAAGGPRRQHQCPALEHGNAQLVQVPQPLAAKDRHVLINGSGQNAGIEQALFLQTFCAATGQSVGNLAGPLAEVVVGIQTGSQPHSRAAHSRHSSGPGVVASQGAYGVQHFVLLALIGGAQPFLRLLRVLRVEGVEVVLLLVAQQAAVDSLVIVAAAGVPQLGIPGPVLIDGLPDLRLPGAALLGLKGFPARLHLGVIVRRAAGLQSLHPVPDALIHVFPPVGVLDPLGLLHHSAVPVGPVVFQVVGILLRRLDVGHVGGPPVLVLLPGGAPGLLGLPQSLLAPPQLPLQLCRPHGFRRVLRRRRRLQLVQIALILSALRNFGLKALPLLGVLPPIGQSRFLFGVLRGLFLDLLCRALHGVQDILHQLLRCPKRLGGLRLLFQLLFFFGLLPPVCHSVLLSCRISA